MGLAALFALVPAGMHLANATGQVTIPVRIVSSADPADVALPFRLTVWTSTEEPVTDYNWTDSLGATADTPEWDLDVDVPGNLTVTLEVTDGAGDHGNASVTIPVHPALSVTLSCPLEQVDSGIPAPFFIRLAGGVPPLDVNWTPSTGGPPGNASWPVDGNYSEQVTFNRTGPGWISVDAVDSLGQSTEVDDLLTEVAGPGSLELTTNGTVGEVGWRVGIAAAIQQGAPPFQWTLTSSLPLSSGETSEGRFPMDGMYRWNVSFAFPGVALLNLTAVDASGVPLAASAAVVVEPPLSVQVMGPSVEPAIPFTVSANITGGLPPYSYQFQLSDGESTNGTLTSTGPALAEFDPLPEAGYSLQVRVTDALEQSSFSTLFLRVAEPTRSTTDPDDAGWATYGGVGVLVVLGVLVALYGYRRFHAPSGRTMPPERSAVPTVRQLMKQSQIIDRDTLLLLCEEAGETPEASRAALQFLIRTAEVHSEPGPGSEDVLRWSGGDHSPPASEGPT